MTRDLVLAPADNIRLVELCGPLDQHLHQIETRLGVEVKRRGNRFQIIGLAEGVRRAESVLQDLYTRAQREPVDSERVHIALQELGMEPGNRAAAAVGSSAGAGTAAGAGASAGAAASAGTGATAGAAAPASDELKVRTAPT
jgi:phosphate starvation-inducible PhoH-like protein